MNTSLHQFLKTSICSLLIGTACLTAAHASTSSSAAAPVFSLPGKAGEAIDLTKLKGQVVMLNFWASWCGPCRTEMPLMDQIYKKYSAAGFTLLGVNVDTDSTDAQKFLSQVPVSFPIAFDRDNKVSKLYEVSAMPSTVFIDRKGNVRALHRGYKPGDEAENLSQIRALI
ncbi:MAG: TlpA disulfide reductase family protein, partial [Steroidobacteraceae bacterium]